MQASRHKVQAFVTSVSQRAVEKAPIKPTYVWDRELGNLQNHTNQEPLHQLFPEVLEYRPPRIITSEPKCFIHNLPPFLLLEIFQDYLYDEEEDDYRTKHTKYLPHWSACTPGLGEESNKYKPALTSNLSSSASPMTLFSVCKWWRNFYDVPSLWASLAVFKPRREQVPEIISWLQRSIPEGASETTRNGPLLSLYLHAPHDDDCDQAVVDSILRLFLSNTERLKSLTVKLVCEFLYPVPPISMPYLQSLELDFFGVDCSPHHWHYICRNVPRVRKISWRPLMIDSFVSGDTMPWQMVTHMKLPFTQHYSPTEVLENLMRTLIHCVNLVDLEIVIALPLKDEDSPMIKSYNYQRQTHLLRRERELRAREAAEIDWDDIKSDYTHCERDDLKIIIAGHIDLPRLRHLKVQVLNRDVSPFLDRITTPSLCSLKITHVRRDQNFRCSSTAGIVFFLERSNPPLTSLSFYDPDMPKIETLRLVSLPLPELRHLELFVAPVGNRIMRALMIAPDWQTDLMPNLHKLVLPECHVSNGHLADMVMSRIQYSALKELRFSLPPAIKTNPKSEMRTASKEQYRELHRLKELTSHLNEKQFKLIVD